MKRTEGEGRAKRGMNREEWKEESVDLNVELGGKLKTYLKWPGDCAYTIPP